jgi:hypothetical protein
MIRTTSLFSLSLLRTHPILYLREMAWSMARPNIRRDVYNGAGLDNFLF